MSIQERKCNMQMNKANLRNNEIVILDKKNNFAAARVSFFFQPAGLETDFFSRRPGFKPSCSHQNS